MSNQLAFDWRAKTPEGLDVDLTKISAHQLIAENLKFIRGERKLSQEQLAERAKLEVNYIKAIEGGQLFPDILGFDNLSRALSVPIVMILSLTTYLKAMRPKTVIEKINAIPKPKMRELVTEAYTVAKKRGEIDNTRKVVSVVEHWLLNKGASQKQLYMLNSIARRTNDESIQALREDYGCYD